ncbi:hypothetical protein TDB9533_00086 [Thalassocella blandensis]|nr:hypothetical protein TDB9533_00086 [Thalassocella blandensis]
MIKRSQVTSEVFKLKPYRGLLDIALLYAKLFLVLLVLFLSNSLVVNAICFLLIGVLQYHFNVLGHDGLHYLLSENKRVNDFLTRWFVQAPVGAPMSLMRSSHFAHHAHLGKPNDADRQYYMVDRFDSSKRFIFWLAKSFFGGMILEILSKLMLIRRNNQQNNKNKRNAIAQAELIYDVLSVFVMQIVIFMLFAYFFGFLSYFLFWCLPIVTVMFGLNVLRSCLEHVTENNCSSENRLFTFKSNFIERFFLSPYNMNLHAEHHIFPSVPYYNLKLLQKQFVDQNVDSYSFEKNYISKLVRVYRNW